MPWRLCGMPGTTMRWRPVRPRVDTGTRCLGSTSVSATAQSGCGRRSSATGLLGGVPHEDSLHRHRARCGWPRAAGIYPRNDQSQRPGVYSDVLPAHDFPDAERLMAMAADLRNTATRRWGVLVLLTVLGAVAGLAYALLRPPEYTATAYLAVVAENPGDSSAVSYAQAYSRIAGQGGALQAAADASGGSASLQELRRSVLAAASPDAPVIELTGTADSADRAANLVNLVANSLTKTANTHTGDTRVRVALLSAAVPPADPTSPQLPLAVAVGAAAGLLL